MVSIPVEKAGEHFGPFFGNAVTQDMPASSEWTRKTLGWDSTGPGLIEDLSNVKYRRFLLDDVDGMNARPRSFSLARLMLGVAPPLE